MLTLCLMAEATLRIFAVSPGLSSLLGHDYEYHQSLHDGFAKIGIDYKVFSPTQPEFAPPSHCVPCFIHFKAGETTFRKIWTRLVNFFFMLVILSRQFTRFVIPTSHTAQTVLFIESFKNSELIAFLLSGIFFGKGASIAVLLRHEPSLYRLKGRLILFLLRCMIKLRGARRFKLFCDSAIVQKSFETKIATPVHVLPIPHTFMHSKTIGAPSPLLRCWWPGIPRRNKGLKIIQELAQSSAKQKIILALSQATPLIEGTPGTTIMLEKLPEVLSRADYIEHMLAADFILLPYDPVQYRSSTSGIFVEAVISGAIPLVTAGTWMAEELKAHHLPELISSFAPQDFSEELYHIAHQSSVRERLNKMKTMYRAFHNPDSFAHLFKAIVGN